LTDCKTANGRPSFVGRATIGPIRMSRKDVLAALPLGASHQKINGAVGMLEDARVMGRTLDRIFCDPVKLAEIAHA
jgi:hypothetical protein